MKNIAQLVQEAHANAVAKGWWKEDRTYGELIALVHSEVSEALEDYRNGEKLDKVWYEHKASDGSTFRHSKLWYLGNQGKPCGIPSELADICIRIFDIAGRYGWGEDLQKEFLENEKHPFKQSWAQSSFAEKISRMHLELSCSFYEFEMLKQKNQAIINLSGVLSGVANMCKEYGIDLDQAIFEKMAYNATRPERHGGKVI